MLCLDEAVLTLARLYREDVFALPADDNFNRANRHSAYRQYVLWMYENSELAKEKSFPSCVDWKIRINYPEPTGQYVGFLLGKLAWTDLDILNIERRTYLDGLPINVPIFCIYILN